MTDAEAQAILDNDRCPTCGKPIMLYFEPDGNEYGTWLHWYFACGDTKDSHTFYAELADGEYHPVWEGE